MTAYSYGLRAISVLPWLIFVGTLHAGDIMERSISVERLDGTEATLTQMLRENDDGSYTVVSVTPRELAEEIYGEICAQSGEKYLSPDEVEVRIGPETIHAFACGQDSRPL